MTAALIFVSVAAIAWFASVAVKNARALVPQPQAAVARAPAAGRA